jgi:hypothetical protein
VLLLILAAVVAWSLHMDNWLQPPPSVRGTITQIEPDGPIVMPARLRWRPRRLNRHEPAGPAFTYTVRVSYGTIKAVAYGNPVWGGMADLPPSPFGKNTYIAPHQVGDSVSVRTNQPGPYRYRVFAPLGRSSIRGLVSFALEALTWLLILTLPAIAVLTFRRARG